VIVEGQQINLELWDCSVGQFPYKDIRARVYQGTDVFVICFSLVAPYSLRDTQENWAPEIDELSPGTPYILAGLKSDLRALCAENPEAVAGRGYEPQPTTKGEEMRNTLKAHAYVECSAKLRSNLKEVFETAVKVALHSRSAAPAVVESSSQDS
jgi:GTPase SAR1 family protein